MITDTTDTECNQCDEGAYSTKYNSETCVPHEECSNEEYLVSAGTPLTNTQCAALNNCSASQYRYGVTNSSVTTLKEINAAGDLIPKLNVTQNITPGSCNKWADLAARRDNVFSQLSAYDSGLPHTNRAIVRQSMAYLDEVLPVEQEVIAEEDHHVLDSNKPDVTGTFKDIYELKTGAGDGNQTGFNWSENLKEHGTVKQYKDLSSSGPYYNYKPVPATTEPLSGFGDGDT